MVEEIEARQILELPPIKSRHRTSTSIYEADVEVDELEGHPPKDGGEAPPGSDSQGQPGAGGAGPPSSADAGRDVPQPRARRRPLSAVSAAAVYLGPAALVEDPDRQEGEVATNGKGREAGIEVRNLTCSWTNVGHSL